jgi:membrane protease YdiL (CAAX protease family)
MGWHMGAVTGSVSVRPAWARSWPPTAEREKVELGVPAVIAILVGGWLLELIVFAITGPGLAPPAPSDTPARFVTRLLVVPGAITVLISVSIVLVLGWHRAAGLGPGRASRWGIVPFGVLLVATVVTLGLPQVSEAGRGYAGLFFLGVLLAALAEEILFRGFLQHGLTRRIGGRRAVLVGSVLFSAAHIPTLVIQGQVDSTTFVVLFGFGVLLCKIRTETGSIWLPTGVHTLWNFVTFVVVGSVPSLEDISPAFIAVKVIPVLAGLVIAVRLLARSPDLKRPAAPAVVFTTQPGLAFFPAPPPPLRTEP